MITQLFPWTVRTCGSQAPGGWCFRKQGWTKLDVVRHFIVVSESAARGISAPPDDAEAIHGHGGGRPDLSKADFERYSLRYRADSLPFSASGSHERASNRKPTWSGSPSWVVSIFIHGLVRDEDTDHPDELRFDFDPTPGVTFDQIRQAASGAKELLDEPGPGRLA